MTAIQLQPVDSLSNIKLAMAALSDAQIDELNQHMKAYWTAQKLGEADVAYVDVQLLKALLDYERALRRGEHLIAQDVNKDVSFWTRQAKGFPDEVTPGRMVALVGEIQQPPA